MRKGVRRCQCIPPQVTARNEYQCIHLQYPNTQFSNNDYTTTKQISKDKRNQTVSCLFLPLCDFLLMVCRSRLPAATEQEREWRRILGDRMVSAEIEEGVTERNDPQTHYNLQVTPENYEKFLRGEELSENVSVELQMPVEDKRMLLFIHLHLFLFLFINFA
jgi:hypothetical protein